MSLPSARSKYARRAAGAPLTTPRRSGVKTSVASSPRSRSIGRSGAPFNVATFGDPGSTVTSTPRGAPARRPCTAIREALSPKRTSSRSERARGEKPCVATCSASSRFVLPAPFGPTASTRPGRSSNSSRSYDRKLRSETVSTISRSARKPNWHHEIGEVVAFALEDRRTERADQLHAHVVTVEQLESVAKEVGVEPDLQRLAGESDRHRLPRLAHLVRPCDHRQLTLREPKL